MIVFVEHILGIKPAHVFYELYFGSVTTRIAALASLGIQNIHIAKLFGKTQPAVSNIIKRTSKDKYTLVRDMRYNISDTIKLNYIKEQVTTEKTVAPNHNKFFIAGGGL